MKLILVCASLLFASLVCADALPEVKLETHWVECKLDSDCDIVRDGCRSCGESIALNKIHIKDFIKRDYAQRKSTNLMITCEACSQQNVVVRCEHNQCRTAR